ncbi:unnamed protein product [Dracunculus medinensis]|uniref:PAS domain-containing protein n=1 Tax=Dracunculus medinensis TaxID=318479 RepID=A0A0N4U447_DRAME|nr:unnamed protein product [Dracunculus medinensis]
MCIISSKELPIISFSSMENLILWESWIDQTCCRGSLFYLQLLAAPEKSRANLSLYREVRLHMHDGRFALVEGRPQRIIGFWRIKDVIRISFISNVLHFFAHDPSGVDDGMYSLACGKIEEIEKHFSMCKKAGVLLSYLRHKSGNDCWLHAYAESVSPVSNRSYTFHYPVLQFNDGFPEAVPPSQKQVAFFHS